MAIISSLSSEGCHNNYDRIFRKTPKTLHVKFNYSKTVLRTINYKTVKPDNVSNVKHKCSPFIKLQDK